MRCIGELDDEGKARRFGDFLFARGIATDIEPSSRGGWEVWVHDDDQLDEAEAHLNEFLADPDREDVVREAAKADALRRRQEKEERKAAKLYRGREALFSRGGFQGSPVTWGLIGLSVAVALLTRLGQNLEPGYILLISEPIETAGGYLFRRDFPEVTSGQVWRLITPIFLHFGILHLVFNMLWLRDLGGMVERHFGRGYIVALIAVVAVLSNSGQYLQSGPMFGGMSGVVYALLGFVWIRGKLDPFSGLFLHPTTVTMMIVWYVVCLVGLVGYIANTVHTIGLLAGAGWGYVSAKRALSRY